MQNLTRKSFMGALVALPFSFFLPKYSVAATGPKVPLSRYFQPSNPESATATLGFGDSEGWRQIGVDWVFSSNTPASAMSTLPYEKALALKVKEMSNGRPVEFAAPATYPFTHMKVETWAGIPNVRLTSIYDVYRDEHINRADVFIRVL